MEKLTDEERELLRCCSILADSRKALRIIDAQAELLVKAIRLLSRVGTMSNPDDEEISGFLVGLCLRCGAKEDTRGGHCFLCASLAHEPQTGQPNRPPK